MKKSRMPWIGDVPEEAPGAGLVLAMHQGSLEHERNSERVLAGLVLRDLAQGDRKARMEMNGMQRKRNVGWLFLLTAVVVALSFAVPAHADLARVGPANVPSPPGNGFPFWYQDLKGLVLDLCLADNPDPGAAQQTACLLVTPPPYSFPTTFPDEAFYHRVVSAPMITDVATGKRAILVLALEAAFGSGVPQAGQQMVFTRIRVTAGVPFPGTYTINHPYGTDVQTVDSVAAGNRDIFFTIDTGLAPLNFTDALTSRVGPFIRASTAPGGVASDPVTINGAQFLGDGVALTKITGSPFGTNWFEMCGPFNGVGTNVCIRTEDFALTGRVHNLATSPIGSPLAVERATFARDAGGNVRIDVSATAAAGIGQAAPKLSVGGQDIPPHRMAGPAGVFNRFFVQDVPAPPSLASTQVTVTNFADVPPTSVSTRLTDEVVVSEATYDASTSTLQVKASSSDLTGPIGTTPPVLVMDEFPNAAVTVLSNITTFTVTPLDVPPPAVVVNSSGGGIGSLAVTITGTRAFDPGVVYAQDDIAAATAGGAAVPINVLFNDTEPVGAPATGLTIVTPPTLGVVAVTYPTVTYTPVNSGTDTFKYTVANSVGTSNVATVTVDVAVNATATPIANPDPAAVSAGSSVNISVLANDSGNGGTLDPTSVLIGTPPTRGSTLVNLTTGAITYTPGGTTAGTATFTYTVKNTNGNTSNAATVTVTITAAVVETVAVKPPAKCNNPNAWDMTGSSSITTGTSSVTLYNTGTVPAIPTASNVIGTATISAGKWQYRSQGALPCKTPISIQSAGGAKQENITVQIK